VARRVFAIGLSEQMRAKHRVFAAYDYDWVVHCDADEWLCSSLQGQSLLHGLAQADVAGFTCVNFHELVSVALPNESFESEDYFKIMQTYYFFQPSYPRLERAWSRRAGLDSSSSGGHRLDGIEKRRSPHDFILRHYISLSEKYGRESTSVGDFRAKTGIAAGMATGSVSRRRTSG
jgi:hypothetical protein